MNARNLVGVIVLVVIVGTWAYIALTGEPRLQVGSANGSYTNGCCGTLVLNNGIMTIASQRIGYVIEQDKAGPYLLPAAYVGASSTGFVIKRDAHALKLRLDDSSHPLQVELFGDGTGGETISFTRTSGS